MQNSEWKLQDKNAEDVTAQNYDYLYNRTWFAKQNYGNFAKTIKRFISKDTRFLELGCGTGTVSSLVGSQCHCIDFSANMLAIAKTKVQSCVQADMEYLPYANEVFDIVFVNSALHHFPSLDKVMNEINRILKKDGYLLVQEPNAHSIRKDKLLELLVVGMKKMGLKQYPDVSNLEVKPSDHHAPLPLSKLSSAIAANGFNIAKQEYRYYTSYIFSDFDSRLAAIAGTILDKIYVRKKGQGYMFVVIAKKGPAIERMNQH